MSKKCWGRRVVISYIKKLPKWQAAYVAACVDTDGSIFWDGSVRRSPALSITNNNLEFLKFIQRTVCGGKLYSYVRKRNEQTKQVYDLRFRVLEIKDLLPQIIPFLIVKKNRAVRALERLNNVY